MAKYIATGKINLPKTLLAVLLGVVLSFGVGVAYSFLMELNPFIILDLVIIVAIVILIAVISAGMAQVGVVRNKVVKFFLALIISITGWYTAWAYLLKNNLFAEYFEFGSFTSEFSRYVDSSGFSIGKMTSSSSITIEGAGMWALVIIEGILFLLPVIIAFAMNKDYFCEKCGKFNEEKKYYIEDAPGDELFSAAETTGNFNDVARLARRTDIPSVNENPDLVKTIYEMEVSCCKSCRKNGVVNVEKGKYKLDDKKEKVEFTREKNVLKNVIVDDFSIGKLTGHESFA